jgi:hypothetical protein
MVQLNRPTHHVPIPEMMNGEITASRTASGDSPESHVPGHPLRLKGPICEGGFHSGINAPLKTIRSQDLLLRGEEGLLDLCSHQRPSSAPPSYRLAGGCRRRDLQFRRGCGGGKARPAEGPGVGALLLHTSVLRDAEEVLALAHRVMAYRQAGPAVHASLLVACQLADSINSALCRGERLSAIRSSHIASE